MLADRIVARDARLRAEELGTVWDLKSWLDLHSVDPTDPFATGIAGGAGRRSGSDGTPLVDEFAVREYAALRHLSEPTAWAFLTDVADLEHRFPRLWAAVQALWLPVWQARKIVAACRELSQEAAALVDTELAGIVAGLPWSRILTRLAAAIMQADPALAERKRTQARQARFVQLCRSEDGITTMIVRADHGDLVMVYALVDRLADILKLDGNTEPADERRATAFGLLAQPAMVLEMLLRHAHDGARPASPGQSSAPDATPSATGRDNESASNAGTWMPARGNPDLDPADDGPVDAATVDEEPDRDEEPGSWPGRDDADTAPDSQQLPPDPRAEPPAWTAEDYDEPDDPEPHAPVWDREPHDPDPPDHHEPPEGSGLRLDLPGLTGLLTQQGLRAARPRVVLNVFLTD